MDERRFNFEYDLPANVTLNIPPFLKGQGQLSLKECVKNLKWTYS